MMTVNTSDFGVGDDGRWSVDVSRGRVLVTAPFDNGGVTFNLTSEDAELIARALLAHARIVRRITAARQS